MELLHENEMKNGPGFRTTEGSVSNGTAIGQTDYLFNFGYPSELVLNGSVLYTGDGII